MNRPAQVDSASAAGAPLEPSESERKALLNLLSDEDSRVHHAVRSKILGYGYAATRWLQPCAWSSDPVLRRRALEIINFLSRQAADNRFLAFCLNQREDLDIEEGALLLAQTQYPEINTLAYRALFDSYAADLRDQLQPGASTEQVVAVINHFLFEELGYRGNEKNYYDPDNSYLNRVVDKRTGNPISLCCLYLFVGRRLGLPVVGVGMPGHFLCRYQTAAESLVFIDAFNKGKLLSKADCVKFLVHTSEGFKESHLAPITGRRIVQRMCSNLHQIYTQLGLVEEITRFQRYIVALAK